MPVGGLSEIVGAPTSGMTTLALKMIAEAQTRAGAPIAYIDPERTFDPDYAARCGVDPGRILVVHQSPPTAKGMVCNVLAEWVGGP